MTDMLDFYKGKKVLVTGHTGFKGSWLCRILVNAGAVVTGYSLNPPTNPSLFEIAGLEDKMNSVIGDIRDYEHLDEFNINATEKVNFNNMFDFVKEITADNPAGLFKVFVLSDNMDRIDKDNDPNIPINWLTTKKVEVPYGEILKF